MVLFPLSPLKKEKGLVISVEKSKDGKIVKFNQRVVEGSLSWMVDEDFGKPSNGSKPYFQNLLYDATVVVKLMESDENKLDSLLLESLSCSSHFLCYFQSVVE